MIPVADLISSGFIFFFWEEKKLKNVYKKKKKRKVEDTLLTLLTSLGITTLNPLFEEILVTTVDGSPNCEMF